MLGRFTLRDEGELVHGHPGWYWMILTVGPKNPGKTIAIGKVTKLRERSEVSALEDLSINDNAA